MKFSKEFLIEALEKNAIVEHITDTSRWSVHYRRVFEHEGKLYETFYSVGATECQDESPYEYADDEIECKEVFRKEKLVTVYE